MRRLLPLLAAAAVGAAEPAPTPVPATTPATAAARPFLGLTIEDLAPTVDAPGAVRVTGITPGGNAERLGVRVGDVLARLDGTALHSVEAFRTAMAALAADAPVRLTVRRDGVELELAGTLEPPPRPRDVLSDADRLRGEMAALKDDVARERVRTRLEELLALAREIETGLPAAAAEFKRLYPDGTFSIQIRIDIRSDGRATGAPLAPAKPADPAPAPQP